MLLTTRTDTSSSIFLFTCSAGTLTTSPRLACCASLLLAAAVLLTIRTDFIFSFLVQMPQCRHTDNEPKAGLLRVVAAGVMLLTHRDHKKRMFFDWPTQAH
jgi:hypothetical protein